jgi:4-amino-4-deoxy-L-arabinose transferase-like glycosyltransferase
MSRHGLVLLVIVAAAIGLRITYTATTGHTSAITSLEGQIAHNIVADGRWFARNEKAETYVAALARSRHRLIDPASVDYTFLNRNARWYPEIAQSVGTSAVIAGLWAVTGDERFVEVQVLQGLVDGLAVLLVYWIAVQLFGRRRPALIAAALYALYPPIAWQTVNPYNDIWAVDFTIAIVAIYLVILRSGHRWRWLVVCGVCGGVGAYFRPEVLVIVPVLALVTAADTGWREALRRALVPTVLGVLLLVPWTIRNYDDFHTFIPIRTGFWETMVGGLSELPNNFGVNHFQIEEEVLRSHPGVVTETPTWDSYFKPYVIRAIEQHPSFYLEVLAHRVAIATVLMHDNSWMHRGAGGLHNYKGGLLAFVLDRPLVVLEDALEPLVFVLAMLGLGLTWRRWSSRHRMLVAVVLCVLVPYIAVHVEGRYLLPAVFVYFIWIGAGADLLIERVKQRRSDPHGHEPPGHEQRSAELQPPTVGGPLCP